jgi:hypothetical protein
LIEACWAKYVFHPYWPSYFPLLSWVLWCLRLTRMLLCLLQWAMEETLIC